MNRNEKHCKLEKGEKLGERIMSFEEARKLQRRIERVNQDEVTVGENVTTEQKNDIVALLNKYTDCVAKDS